jgi:mRNA-degrading endonuclease RelE of RelBE toxin-antitoxin system
MRYDIVFGLEAVEDLQYLKTNLRAGVRDAIEQHLRHQSRKLSKSRIKRLHGLSHPQYRLRIGDDLRVFYDVAEEVVQILAIVVKSEVDVWLAQHGESDETSSSV